MTDFALPPEVEARAGPPSSWPSPPSRPTASPRPTPTSPCCAAWLEAWSGRSDRSYAAAVVDEFHRHGCFTEHNSPTYYGVDLLALGLWQRPDSPADLQRWGADIEAALWTDVARWWHPGLGNLCGPYSRAYGMDLHAYVSGLGLALWCADLPAPLPDLDVEPLPHGHDLCMAPLLQHVGVRVPADARAAFERFAGPHVVEQVVQDDPRRVATGWLDHDRMVGAEAGAGGLQARGQYHPATIHWRRPDGGVGWLRLVHHAPTRATASEGRLEVSLDPHPRHGPVDGPLGVQHRGPSRSGRTAGRSPAWRCRSPPTPPLLDPATRTYAPSRHASPSSSADARGCRWWVDGGRR